MPRLFRPAPLGAAALALFLGALAVAPGCGDGEAQGALQIAPAAHDFGRVRYGTEHLARFVLTNHTDQPMTIRNVQTNCACFHIDRRPGIRLEAGDSSELLVRFHATAPAQPGRVEGKRLEVFTDHPDAALVRAPLEGEIYSPYIVSPRDSLDIGMIGDGRNDDAVHEIHVRAETDFEVALDRSIAGRPDGWSLDGRARHLFDVEAEDTADGAVLRLRVKKGARPLRRNRLHAELVLHLKASGRDMPEERFPHAIAIMGSWVPE